MSSAQRLRILFAESREIVQAGYRQIVDELNADAWYAFRHPQATSCFADQNPDLVVLDVALPPDGGMHTAEQILNAQRDARILLTADTLTAAQLELGTRIGITGFIHKGASLSDYVQAFEQVTRGKRYVHPLFVQCNGHDSARLLRLLSPREFEVFKLLAAGHSPGAIASELDITLKTASNHSTRIKRKLKVRSVASLTLLAVRANLLDV